MLLAHPDLTCPRCNCKGIVKFALSSSSLLLVSCQTCGDFDTRPGIQFDEKEFEEIMNRLGWEKLPTILQGLVQVAEFLDIRNLFLLSLKNNPWVDATPLGGSCQICQSVVLFTHAEEDPHFTTMDDPKFRPLLKEASEFLLQHRSCPDNTIQA